MEETKDSAAPAQDAAQPEATGTPPAKSAAETKLESQLAAAIKKGEGYKKERDAARADLGTALSTITAQAGEIAQLKAEPTKPAEVATTSTAPEAPAEPSKEEVLKDILRRNNLKKCWVLPAGPCFSEAHAREYAGDEFDSLTVISVEENAGTN